MLHYEVKLHYHKTSVSVVTFKILSSWHGHRLCHASGHCWEYSENPSSTVVSLPWMYSSDSQPDLFKEVLNFGNMKKPQGTKSGEVAWMYEQQHRYLFLTKNHTTGSSLWEGEFHDAKFTWPAEELSITRRQNVWLTVYFEVTNSQWIISFIQKACHNLGLCLRYSSFLQPRRLLDVLIW